MHAYCRALHNRVLNGLRIINAATGIPPSWACKDGVREAVKGIQQALHGNQGGLDINLWRWKFLWFPADRSHRPPAYGSFSKKRSAHALVIVCTAFMCFYTWLYISVGMVKNNMTGACVTLIPIAWCAVGAAHKGSHACVPQFQNPCIALPDSLMCMFASEMLWSHACWQQGGDAAQPLGQR